VSLPCCLVKVLRVVTVRVMSLGFYSFDEAKLQKVSILHKLFLKLFEIKKGARF